MSDETLAGSAACDRLVEALRRKGEATHRVVQALSHLSPAAQLEVLAGWMSIEQVEMCATEQERINAMRESLR